MNVPVPPTQELAAHLRGDLLASGSPMSGPVASDPTVTPLTVCSAGALRAFCQPDRPAAAPPGDPSGPEPGDTASKPLG